MHVFRYYIIKGLLGSDIVCKTFFFLVFLASKLFQNFKIHGGGWSIFWGGTVPKKLDLGVWDYKSKFLWVQIRFFFFFPHPPQKYPLPPLYVKLYCSQPILRPIFAQYWIWQIHFQTPCRVHRPNYFSSVIQLYKNHSAPFSICLVSFWTFFFQKVIFFTKENT